MKRIFLQRSIFDANRLLQLLTEAGFQFIENGDQEGQSPEMLGAWFDHVPPPWGLYLDQRPNRQWSIYPGPVPTSEDPGEIKTLEFSTLILEDIQWLKN